MKQPKPRKKQKHPEMWLSIYGNLEIIHSGYIGEYFSSLDSTWVKANFFNREKYFYKLFHWAFIGEIK